MARLRVRWWMSVSVVGFVALLLLGMADQFFVSLGSVNALRTLFVSESYRGIAMRTLYVAATSDANALWILGMMAKAEGDTGRERQSFDALLMATPERIPLLAIVAAEDERLAERAIALYPQRGDAMAWRARQLEDVDAAQSVEIYRRALSLEPNAYQWWLGLGRAYETLGDDPSALIAFEEACRLATGILSCEEVRRVRGRLEQSDAAPGSD